MRELQRSGKREREVMRRDSAKNKKKKKKKKEGEVREKK